MNRALTKHYIISIAMEGPLAHRQFRRLFAAQVAALIGTGLLTFALSLLLHDLSGENVTLVLGRVLALKMIAYVVVAPIATVFLRFAPRRQVLVWLDIVRAVSVLCLPWVNEVWQVYLVIVVLNTSAAAFKPLFQATVAHVLTDEADYTRALSLTRLSYDLENLLSPALSVLLLLVVSYPILFVTNGVLFLLSAVLVLGTTLPGVPRDNHGSEASQSMRFMQGLSIYLLTPRLQSLLALNLSVAATGAMVLVNSIALVQSQLGRGEGGLALVMMCLGVGSMITAFFLPSLLRYWPEGALMRIGVGLSSSALLAGTLLPLELPTVGALWFIVGLGNSAVQTAGSRLLRRSALPQQWPDVFAAHFSLSHACWLVFYPLAGWLYWLSPTSAFLGLGVIGLGGLIISLGLWRSYHEHPITHEHPAMAHAHDGGHDGVHQPRDSTLVGTSRTTVHSHAALRHSHRIIIDAHHPRWPRRSSYNS